MYCSLLHWYDAHDGCDEHDEDDADDDNDGDVRMHLTDLHLLLMLHCSPNDSLFHKEISLPIRIVVEMLNDNSQPLDRDSDDELLLLLNGTIDRRVTMLAVRFYRLIPMMMKQVMEFEQVKGLFSSLRVLRGVVSMTGHLSN